MLSLVKTVAAENRDAGVTANVVLPGTMDTPANRMAMPDADFARWVQPANVASLIVWLASDAGKEITGAALPVYGDGLNVRDWIHVDDHCAGIVAALFEGKPGTIYNFGGGREMVNLDVVKLILKKLGKPESLISFVTDRLGHDRRYAIDSSFSQRELNWKPRHNFEEGLAETIQWYIDNQAWWQPLLERAGRY